MAHTTPAVQQVHLTWVCDRCGRAAVPGWMRWLCADCADPLQHPPTTQPSELRVAA